MTKYTVFSHAKYRIAAQTCVVSVRALVTRYRNKLKYNKHFKISPATLSPIQPAAEVVG